MLSGCFYKYFFFGFFLRFRIDLCTVKGGEKLNNQINIQGKQFCVWNTGFAEYIIQQQFFFIILVNFYCKVPLKPGYIGISVPFKAIHSRLKTVFCCLTDFYQSGHDCCHAV